MAHLVESIAWSGQRPWHGLGKEVLPDLTPKQMLQEAGLDWEVKLYPSYIVRDGKAIATGDSALVREDRGEVLTNTSNIWEPCQNLEAFEFFEEYVMSGGMEMHTAGSLKSGRMVWALAKVKESFTVFGKDRVESFLLFSNPHEYGKSIDIRFTPIRVVCNNTLTLSLKQKSDMMIRFDHRKPFNAAEAKEVMGIASSKLNQYKEMATFLGSKRYTKDTLEQYIKTLFPNTSPDPEVNKELSRPGQKVFELVETQPGYQYASGTWWQPFNAATFAMDHVLGLNQDSRLYSSWYGANRNRKIKALEDAVEFAKAA